MRGQKTQQAQQDERRYSGTKVYYAEYEYYGVKRGQSFFLPSERDVRAEISKMGGVPLMVTEQVSSIFDNKLSVSYGLKLLRAVNFHMNAGVSAGKSLSICIEAETDLGKRKHLQQALDIIYGGGMFSDAMEQIKIFNRTVIAMLKSGEESGKLNEAIKSAINYLESSKKNWRLLLGGLSWVAFDFFSAISSVIGMQYGLLPWLEKNGIDKNALTPEQVEKFSTALSQTYFINNLLMWGTISFIVIAIIFFVLYWRSTNNKIKKFLNNILIKIPVIKSVLFDGSLADSFALVGRMIESKVPIMKAMTIAADSSYIPGIRDYWSKVRMRIYYGDTISKAMSVGKMLNKNEIMELEAHQNSEQLSTIILNISEERNYHYDKGIKKLIRLAIVTTVIYTIIVIGLAIRVIMIQNEGLSQSMRSIGGL